jgi:hypothetical protein
MARCLTTALHGKGGSLTGMTGSSEIHDWTLNLTQDIADVSSFDYDFRMHVAGLKGGTGSFNAVGSPPVMGAYSDAVFRTGTDNDPKVTCDVILTTINIVATVEDAVRYSADFTICGEWTYVNA